ncbi:MAG TPA: helix-turn-helix transcriptional regulator [Candidatus Acidoferrum sp.]|nr:helix-turn-helix transcriptional regulator [Candidatus Acidoferrum sp.]
MLPGLRLRQARERLGLTYRDVERASFELAALRGRPEMILHISRLADIENRGVTPGLHKLYTLAVVYHLNPLDIFRWYDVPIENCFPDGSTFLAPQTHLAAPPVCLRTPLRFDPAFDPKRTELLSRMVEQWGSLEGVLTNRDSRHRYGYIGLSDRRMVPLLRPGSVVLVDATMRYIEDDNWANEYDRPIYFVEVRDGYRCGWFHQAGARLLMQPHPLSRCVPESWQIPDEAEVIGRVVGVVTRLTEPWNILPEESPAARANSSRKAP